MHPNLFQLLQILNFHHGELERHMYFLEDLNVMVSRLLADNSNFGGENCVAIITLRGVVQEPHTTLHYLIIAPRYIPSSISTRRGEYPSPI